MHYLAAVLAGAGTDVDDPVGGADGVLVVFDDDERVAQVAELEQRLDEAVVVALVQADAGLVEHVQHSGEAGADLGGQPDALSLSPGQRAGGAGQIQVGESDLDEELQARPDLPQHGDGDFRLARRQFELVDERERVDEAEFADVGDAAAVHRDGEHLRLEPLAVADRAVDLAQVVRVALPGRIGLGLEVFAFDVGDDAFEPRRVLDLPAVPVLPAHGHREVVAVQDGFLDVLGQLGPRRRQREVEVGGETLEQPLEVVEQALARLGPRAG